MAARSSWKGYLKVSLISVPVKAYTATATGSEIHLNQLHANCNSRIQYRKTCPIHGEVKGDEIVSGYEYAKGQYVLIDTDELDKLRTESDKAIKVDAFVEPDEIDPIHFEGKSYYLVPDGPVATRPYAVIHQAMAEEDRYAVAQVVFSGREQVVLLGPMGRLFVMSMLAKDNEINKIGSYEEDVPKVDAAPEEVELAKSLIKAQSGKQFDFAKYKDVYTEKLSHLIEAKVKGQELVLPPSAEEPQVINLMDALKQSVAQASGQAASAMRETGSAKPPKKMAETTKKPAARKKKSS